MSERRIEFENWGRMGYVQVVFEEETGGFVVIHPDHGQHEWEQNKQIARMLAAHGDAIVLMPAKPDLTNYDATRNEEAWEFKTVRVSNIENALQDAIRRGKKQASNILCFIDSDNWEVHQITLGIYTAVKFDLKIQAVRLAILFRSGKLVEMTREEVRNGAFRNLF